MEIHVGILTSSDAKKALRCAKSCLAQIFPPEITVIVNSTKGYYYDDVYELFKKELPFINVIETKSNGKPGKGKNSAMEYMSNNINADYYMLLDGDDFLYSTAFELLLPLMEEGHDYIAGLSQDHWRDGELALSWHETQPNNAVTINRDIIKGRDYDLWNSFSIDRMYAMSKKFLISAPKFPEHMDLYEDFVFTAHCTKLWKIGALDYVRVNSSYIYGYDASGESQCSIFHTDTRLAQWNMDEFWREMDELKPVLFSEVPFKELPLPKESSVQHKNWFYQNINANEAYSRTE